MSEPSPLGHLAVANAERDAVHVAIIPVRALEKLMPGDHVGFVEANGVSRQALEKVGIIDPFLSRAVRANQWCYLLLYPNTVTGMRHHWQHPAFPETSEPKTAGPSREESRQWLLNFANQAGLTFNEVLEYTKQVVRSDGWYPVVQFNGESWRDAYYDNEAEFWVHFQNFTGEVIPEDRRRAPWSCSC